MATFCTTSDLQTLMLGTTFDTATTALVAKCIVWAENDIRKHLSKRYDVSSDYFQTAGSTPPSVITMCEMLSMGYSYRVMSRGSKEMMARAKELTDPVMKQLKELSEQKISLYDTAGSALPENTGARPAVRGYEDGYEPTFNEDPILSWEVDSDKLNDIADDRES